MSIRCLQIFRLDHPTSPRLRRGGNERAIPAQRSRAKAREPGLKNTSRHAPTLLEPRLLDICAGTRSEEHTSELQSLMRISYAVFCLKKKKQPHSRHQ